MNTGKYSKRVTFIDNLEIDDNQGGGIIGYSSLINVWASVVPFSSNQVLQFGQISTAQGYNIECRNLKTLVITTNHGVMFNDKILTIHSCDTLTDPMRMKIIAFEK